MDATKTRRGRYRQVDFWASDGPASHHCTCYSTTEGYVKDESSKGLVRTIQSEVNKQPAMSHNFRNRNRTADTVDGIEFLQMDSRAPLSLIGLGAKLTETTGDFLAPRPAHDDYSSCFSFSILVSSTLCSTTTVSGLLIIALRT